MKKKKMIIVGVAATVLAGGLAFFFLGGGVGQEANGSVLIHFKPKPKKNLNSLALAVDKDGKNLVDMGFKPAIDNSNGELIYFDGMEIYDFKIDKYYQSCYDLDEVTYLDYEASDE